MDPYLLDFDTADGSICTLDFYVNPDEDNLCLLTPNSGLAKASLVRAV